MPRKGLQTETIRFRVPGSMKAELEAVALARILGNGGLSELGRKIFERWLTENRNTVEMAKAELSNRKTNLNLHGVEAERWLNQNQGS